MAHEEGNLNDLRAILGNDIAIKAYREGKLPFPDGTIIARLAWSYVSSEENNKVFGRPQSFVPGPPTNVQFMVKDSKKYMSTGGWGFAQFNDGKPADVAVQDCFSCHVPVGRNIDARRDACPRSAQRHIDAGHGVCLGLLVGQLLDDDAGVDIGESVRANGVP